MCAAYLALIMCQNISCRSSTGACASIFNAWERRKECEGPHLVEGDGARGAKRPGRHPLLVIRYDLAQQLEVRKLPFSPAPLPGRSQHQAGPPAPGLAWEKCG